MIKSGANNQQFEVPKLFKKYIIWSLTWRVLKNSIWKANNKNSNKYETCTHDLIFHDFSFEENDWKDQCCYDGSSSHHLINRPWYEVQCNHMQSWSYDITESRNRKQEFIEFNLKTFFFCLLLSFLKTLRVSVFHEKEKQQSQKLAKKDCDCLNKKGFTCI